MVWLFAQVHLKRTPLVLVCGRGRRKRLLELWISLVAHKLEEAVFPGSVCSTISLPVLRNSSSYIHTHTHTQSQQRTGRVRNGRTAHLCILTLDNSKVTSLHLIVSLGNDVCVAFPDPEPFPSRQGHQDPHLQGQKLLPSSLRTVSFPNSWGPSCYFREWWACGRGGYRTPAVSFFSASPITQHTRSFAQAVEAQTSTCRQLPPQGRQEKDQATFPCPHPIESPSEEVWR
jgi:hypothetical protein